MTDHPLLFRGEMVRALLAGTKTQTRRPAWRAIRVREGDGWRETPCLAYTAANRIKVGDLVWVRETWAAFEAKPRRASIVYRADYLDGERRRVDAPWRPSIHMPRWISRVTLTVTGARIERLLAITEEDAKAEGAPLHSSYRLGFSHLYGSIHGGAAWFANPEVVVLTFTVHKANIDAFKKRKAA